MSELPLVAVTLGDPASIGPEIVVKALADPAVRSACRPVVVGDSRVLARAMGTTGTVLELQAVEGLSEGRFAPGTLVVVDVPVVDVDGLVWGRIQADAGRAAFAYIEKAIALASRGDVDAVATAPVNKEAWKAAGVPFIGHTEVFAELTGTDDPLTMFETKGLRVFFLTRHLSLVDAIRRITPERTLDALRRAARALARLGVARPRLAVAALNPHAGEHGLFGDEEARLLAPAIEAARAEGLDAAGPLPGDSVFWQAAHGAFDAVLSLYHDQGHIAAKMYDFERTVSITNGLPFLRTSVDHGTAFDIAGTGRASAVSMVEAILSAARYAGAFRRRGGTG